MSENQGVLEKDVAGGKVSKFGENLNSPPRLSANNSKKKNSFVD